MEGNDEDFKKSKHILKFLLDNTPLPAFVIDFPKRNGLLEKQFKPISKANLEKIVVVGINEFAKKIFKIDTFESPTCVTDLFPSEFDYVLLDLLVTAEQLKTPTSESISSNVNFDGVYAKITLTPLKLPEQEKIVSLIHIIPKKQNETISSWEFGRNQLLSLFDSIDEVIYISDPFTYDILFVNEFFQDLLKDDIHGKKCYEAFQGFDAPCEFCTNEIILALDGTPYRWEYYNKQLDTHFQITDRIISWIDGRKARFEIAIDITKQKQIQQQLMSSKIRAERIVNTVQSPMIVISPEFRVLSANRAYSELFSLETSDYVNQSLFQINEGIWDDSALRSVLTDNIEKSSSYSDFRIKVLIPEIGERIFSINVRIISKADNSVKSILLSFIDLTNQIRTIELEKQARFYAEKRLDEFMNASPIAFLILSADFHVLVGNAQSTILFPNYCNQSDLIGKHISEMHSPYSDTERLEKYRFVIEENQLFLSEDILSIGETKKHFSTKFFKVADGLGVIARDITESRILMHSLQERVKEMTCLLDTSRIIRDESLDIDTAIPKIIKVIKSGWQFPDITAVRIEIESEVYTSDNHRESEYKQRAKIGIDDTILGWLEVSYIETPPYDDIFLTEEYRLIKALGIQIGAAIIRRRAQEAQVQLNLDLEKTIRERTKELKDAQEQLLRKERLALLGELSGSIGHELRNPLSAIKNAAFFLDMILDDSNPDIKESIDIIQKEIDSCNRIIEGLLDYARPKKSEYKFVNLRSIILESLETVEIPDTVEVIKQLDETPSTFVDPHQIKIAFINLITNAIQAMKEGGKLTITLEEKDNQIIIVVADTGIGIAEENLDKVFRPLFTTKTHGIGFGLSIVKNLIFANNGTIELDSQEGIGTTFTIRIAVKGAV
ncbi:MAG: PAS domain-containing protein [Candidatus Lokiarchaeota archaeon]|nr:PAS domain-containing protein [Candidatus Lokiarchaeota archaeon]